MKRLSICLMALIALLMGHGAQAQYVLPAPSQVVSPPPPPSIEAPKVPRLDAPPSYNDRPLPRNSFSDRVSKCLDDAAAAGLGPADRGTYARSCAN